MAFTCAVSKCSIDFAITLEDQPQKSYNVLTNLKKWQDSIIWRVFGKKWNLWSYNSVKSFKMINVFCWKKHPKYCILNWDTVPSPFKFLPKKLFASVAKFSIHCNFWVIEPMIALKHCVCACVLSGFSHVQLSVTPWTVVCQILLFIGFSRQKHWNRLPCPLL